MYICDVDRCMHRACAAAQAAVSLGDPALPAVPQCLSEQRARARRSRLGRRPPSRTRTQHRGGGRHARVRGADAPRPRVQIFLQMLPLIERQARCLPLIELAQGIVTKSCPAVSASLQTTAVGFALSAAGLTLVGFLICACWRKLVKPASAAVAPGYSDGYEEGFKDGKIGKDDMLPLDRSPA